MTAKETVTKIVLELADKKSITLQQTNLPIKREPLYQQSTVCFIRKSKTQASFLFKEYAKNLIYTKRFLMILNRIRLLK